MNRIAWAAALWLAAPLAVPGQEKYSPEGVRPESAKIQEPRPERRDPTESDLPRGPALRTAVPSIVLKGIVVVSGKGGAAVLEMDGRTFRVRQGDQITVGVTPGSPAPAAPSGGTGRYPIVPAVALGRRPEGRPISGAAGGIATVLRIAELTADELKIEIAPSGDVVVLR